VSRRVLVVALSSALFLGGLGASATTALAVPDAPTQQQLEDAASRVARASQHLADVQVQAERAAEAYNGACVRAAAAARRDAAAREASAEAQHVAERAARRSAAAASDATAATAAATAAAQEQERAVQAAQAAQQAFDDYIAGAYRTGGDIALRYALVGTDLDTYAVGMQLLDRAAQHQRTTVDALLTARQAAEAATTRAQQAEARANARATRVRATADAAAQASDTARAAAQAAAEAAAQAKASTVAAADSKRRAVAMAAAAERALDAAGNRAADLQAQARQARRDAQAARRAAALAARLAAQQAAGSAAPGTLPDASAPSASSRHDVQTVIARAYSQVGVPYAWGGGSASGPTRGFAQGAGTVGFDCSGLTLYAYAGAGVRLDHFTGAQWDRGQRISSRADLRPGDLMFFATDPSDPSTIHHVSLYLGDGQMIHAPHTGDVVRVASYDMGGFIGGVRLLG